MCKITFYKVDTGDMNGLKQLYSKQPVSVRSKIREDLEARGLTYQRLSYWINKENAVFFEMPLILKQIICSNIPAAEKLFELPELNIGIKNSAMKAEASRQ